MAGYRIQRKTLTDLADQVRQMAGTAQLLTPAEMLLWLKTVQYIPQGWANSTVVSPSGLISVSSTGIRPEMQNGLALSSISLPLALNITSTIV